MMYHKIVTYACAICGKQTLIHLLYDFEGNDVCATCLELLKGIKD